MTYGLLLKHNQMRTCLIFLLSILPAMLFSQSDLPAKIKWDRKKTGKGLVWKHAHPDGLYGSRQNLNMVVVHPKKRRVDLLWRQDTLVRTSEMANRAQAAAAINAGFFNMKAGGSVTPLRDRGYDIVVDQQTGNREVMEGVLAFDGYGHTRIVAAEDSTAWQSMPGFLFTGPLLLLNGRPQPLDDNAFNKTRHPRSCICTLRNGKVLLLTADGRHEEAQGLSLQELTDLTRSLGCLNALNLDGGGSTTLWIKGLGIVNRPSDNKKFDAEGERRVANAVGVW